MYLNADIRIVRIITVMLAGAGGIGVAAYVLAWALTPVAPDSVGVRRPRGANLEALMLLVGLALAVLVLRHAGLRVAYWLVWPLVLATAGIALIWRPIVTRPQDGEEPPEHLSWRGYLRSRRGRIDLPRLAIGALLVAFAVAGLLHAAGVQRNLGESLGAVAVVGAVAALLILPLFARLVRSLASERSARIREQERAELAAHLHDSVLQTLALIQKRAEDPREVASLARHQERDLRRWLFERPDESGGDSVRAALRRAVGEVEELQRVPIEAVIVGDQPLDARLDALVPAAREALTNAAKFAGTDRIDLYAEIDERRVEVFVRDRGCGFDLDQMPDDRRGVRDSIVGRVERHGGRVAIRTAPGEGTEVQLTMECSRS